MEDVRRVMTYLDTGGAAQYASIVSMEPYHVQVCMMLRKIRGDNEVVAFHRRAD